MYAYIIYTIPPDEATPLCRNKEIGKNERLRFQGYFGLPYMCVLPCITQNALYLLNQAVNQEMPMYKCYSEINNMYDKTIKISIGSSFEKLLLYYK